MGAANLAASIPVRHPIANQIHTNVPVDSSQIANPAAIIAHTIDIAILPPLLSLHLEKAPYGAILPSLGSRSRKNCCVQKMGTNLLQHLYHQEDLSYASRMHLLDSKMANDKFS